MKAFRSSLVTLVVQNLPEIVLYIDFRVLSLLIKAVAFLFLVSIIIFVIAQTRHW